MNEGINVRTDNSNVFIVVKMYIYHFIKRVFDLFVSLVGCIFLLPIAFVVKIVYLCNGDSKTIFYKQRRVGKNGKVFELYKFRSMVCNADEVLNELLKDEKYKKQWDKYQKIDDDPRITKIGKLLRKSSMDELPQLINVLRGDMSMIGPRPLVEGELDIHEGNHELYESIRPGITGWWAVSGRSNISYEDRLNLEYYYVQNIGFSLDIKCIFKTIAVVFKSSGAK